MRLFFCTLVFVHFFSSQVFSQVNSPKGFVCLSVGISFPLSNFVSTDKKNEKAGFAETGFRLSMPFGYLFESNIGIGGILFTQKNQVDLDALTSQFSIPPNAKLSTIPWSAEGILVGPYLSFPVDTVQGVSLDFQFSAGIINASIPVLLINSVYYGRGYYSVYSASTKSASAVAFAYSADVSMNFRIANRLKARLSANYFSTTPTFENIPVTEPGKESYEQPMTTFNFDAGIAYFLK